MRSTRRVWRRGPLAVAAAIGVLLATALVAHPAAGTVSMGGRDPGASVAADGVVQACVHKRSGRIRLMTGARCHRGERRISWNRIGATGPAGLAGGTLQVTDGAGAVVPNVVNVSGSGLQILVGAGIYDYAWDGRLEVLEYAFYLYVGATCSGVRFFPYGNPSMVPGGPLRMVVRNPDHSVSVLVAGAQQTLTAGTLASTYTGSPPVCVALAPAPSDIAVTTLLVDTAPLPPDLPGPLRLSLT